MPREMLFNLTYLSTVIRIIDLATFPETQDKPSGRCHQGVGAAIEHT